MADVITRFKLETTQYDSKLRDAAKGLSDYARVAAFAGNEFDKFTKDQAEAARALGSISTSANNAKDKVRELVNAYNQAANAYNALTKEQQQSDWGKALAESINTLKGRITEAKQELYSMGDSAKNSGGIMDVLAQKFTVNIDALKLFNVGLSAAKAALDVAKDAFFASEANVDEWGRTMASAEALYSGFVTALNSSDFSSFLTQIDGIVQAARDAYNELDKLGTMRTIQAPGFAKQEAENQRLRLMIMTGKFIEAGDGRKSPIGLKNGDILSPEQIRILERQLQNGMNKIVSLTKNELGQTGKAIDAYYNSLAKQNGMSIQEFRQGTSSWDAYQEKMRGYEQYQKWNDKAAADYYRQGGRNGFMNFDNGNPYLEFKKWGVFRVDKMGTNSYNDLVGLIKQQQQQQQQMYSTLGQTYRTINRAEGVTVRGLLNGGGGGKGGGGGSTNSETVAITGSIDAQTKKVQELQKAWRAAADDDSRLKIKEELESAQAVLDNMTEKVFDTSNLKQIAPTAIAVPKMELSDPMGTVNTMKQSIQLELKTEAVKVDETTLQTMLKDAVQNGINGMDLNFAILGEKIGRGIDVPDSAWQNVLDQYNELKEQIGLDPIVVNFQTGGIKNVVKGAKDTAKSMSEAASAISSVGNALSSIEDPTAKVAGIVAQAIATIAQAFAGALAKDGTTKTNIWAFIGASAASMAAMVSAISQVHSATGYAQGGIVDGRGGGFVGGTAYSGDNIGNVRLDSGELVLNRAQQNNLANALQSNPMRWMQLSAVITGEQIRLVLNNNGRRTGRGEYVTTNFT